MPYLARQDSHLTQSALDFSRALFECPGRNEPEDTPICSILQNTLEESIHDGIINLKSGSSMATPTTTRASCSVLRVTPPTPIPTMGQATSSLLIGGAYYVLFAGFSYNIGFDPKGFVIDLDAIWDEVRR